MRIPGLGRFTMNVHEYGVIYRRPAQSSVKRVFSRDFAFLLGFFLCSLETMRSHTVSWVFWCAPNRGVRSYNVKNSEKLCETVVHDGNSG